MDIYESLINGNKKYGSNKDHICESNFKCKSFEINEKVIILLLQRGKLIFFQIMPIIYSIFRVRQVMDTTYMS